MNVVWGTRHRFWPLARTSAASSAGLTSTSVTAWTYLRIEKVNVGHLVFSRDFLLYLARTQRINWSIVQEIGYWIVVNFNKSDKNSEGLIFIQYRNPGRKGSIHHAKPFVLLFSTSRSPKKFDTSQKDWFFHKLKICWFGFLNCICLKGDFQIAYLLMHQFHFGSQNCSFYYLVWRSISSLASNIKEGLMHNWKDFCLLFKDLKMPNAVENNIKTNYGINATILQFIVASCDFICK